MTQSVYIELNLSGSDAGPFDLYSNVDSYSIPFEIGVPKSSLNAGYTSSLVPSGATTIEVKSTGSCTNYATASILGVPPYIPPVITDPLITLTSVENPSSIYGSHGDLLWYFNTQLTLSLATFEVSTDGINWTTQGIYGLPDGDQYGNVIIVTLSNNTAYYLYTHYNYFTNDDYYFRISGLSNGQIYLSNVITLTINITSPTSSVHNISTDNDVNITLSEDPGSIILINDVNFLDGERKDISPTIGSIFDFSLSLIPANFIIGGTVSMFVHPYNVNVSVPMVVNSTLDNATAMIYGVDLSTPTIWGMDTDVRVYFDVESQSGSIAKIYYSSKSASSASVILYYKLYSEISWRVRNVTLHRCGTITSNYFVVLVPNNESLMIGLKVSDTDGIHNLTFVASTDPTDICDQISEFSGVDQPATFPISGSQEIYIAADTSYRVYSSSCLVSNTLITMSDNSVKEIKDINIGDYLLTISDSIFVETKVIDKSTHIVDSVININNGLLISSDSHNHLIRIGNDIIKTSASNLKLGDILIGIKSDIIIDSLFVDNTYNEVVNISTDRKTYIANNIFTHNKYIIRNTTIIP